MELQRRPDQSPSERKGQKRKLEEEFEDQHIFVPPTGDVSDALLSDIKEHVSILDSTSSWTESDRAAAKRATHALADLAKNGKILFRFAARSFLRFIVIRMHACLCLNYSVVAVVEEVVSVIVEGGAVPALIMHLQAPPLSENDRIQKPLPFEHEVEKGSAFALGLLAVKVTSTSLFSFPINY